jgi:hypothetical protein
MSFLDGILNVGKTLLGGGKSNPIVDVGLKLGKSFFDKKGGSSEDGGTRSFMQLPDIDPVRGATLARLRDQQFVDERIIQRYRNKITASKSFERLFAEAERAAGNKVSALRKGLIEEKRPTTTGKTIKLG